MHIKSILNGLEKHKGFVYGKVEFDKTAGEKTLLVWIKPRKGSMGYCSGCGSKGSQYDKLPPRRFQFVPLWGIIVFFVYAMRRIDCKSCGPTVEMVPWADGKKRACKTFLWFLAHWAKVLSWKGVAESFHTSWDTVFRAVEAAVEWGLKNADYSDVTSIGVDEVNWKKGYKFLTLVYQIDGHRKRLIWIGQNRTEATIKAFFKWFGKDRSDQIKYICSDMWKPYLKVFAAKARNAINILDRFHIMSHFSKAIDEVRAGEARDMKKKGLEPVLKGSRWCWLKRQANLTLAQAASLNGLLKMNLKTVKSYLLKEDFQNFWEYTSAGCASKFLDDWTKRAMRSKIDPVKKVAKMLRNHKPLLMNWFKAKGQLSSGVVEGLNNKAKTTAKKSYGFRTYKAIRIAYFHALGDLPEPKHTHRFC
jgi:transposase